MKIVFGTYTKKQSRGIYSSEFNEESGLFSTAELECEIESPTYLTPYKEGYLSVKKQDSLGGIALIAAGHETIFDVAAGSPPCYVSTVFGLLLSANYHKGCVDVYAEKNNTLLHLQNIAYGEGSHAHFIDVNPYDNRIYVCDLGLDTLISYTLDHDLLVEVDRITLKAGSGPRHLAFDPVRPLVYCICELSNTVDVIDIADSMRVIQSIDGLASHENRRSGAAIRLSKNRKNLYISNRGTNTLSVFAVDGNGLLEMIQEVDCGGTHPRDFNLSFDEQWVLVANMDTDNVVVFKRDLHTGKLEQTAESLLVPEVVCVCC